MFTKYFTAALAVVFMAFASLAPANAWTVVTNTTDQLFNAVAEVSTTLKVRRRGTPITIFVNGTYAVGNVVKLQRERGSPGSGAWVNVQLVTKGVADATVQTTYITRRDRENLRLNMTATGTGAVVAYMTDAPKVPTEYTDQRLYQVFFDDFGPTQTTAIDAQKYVSIDGDGGASGTICVNSLNIQEGGLVCVSGTGEDAADVLAFSMIDVSDDGALVSDGTAIFEVRMKASDYDGQVGMCLHDEEAVSSQLTPFDIDSNAIVFNSSNQADAVCIMAQDEADTADIWQPASAINDALGNNADEWDLGPAVVNAVYTILRIEINNNGDALFYVSGSLMFAEPLAVALTARLIPFVWSNTTTDGAGGAITYTIDYLVFTKERPGA